jgi:hypothetical protein
VTVTRRRIHFPAGGSAWAVDVPADVSGRDVLDALRLPPCRATVVVNGSAVDIGAGLGEALAGAFGEGGLAGEARRRRWTTVTGATDAGIFSILGRAMAGCPAPIVGVAPQGLVTAGPATGGPDAERVNLEPHHSHFVLVDGSRWGDETGVLLGLARALGAAAPSVAVICGGGPVTRRETLGHVRDGRPVVVLGGSGRFADELAAAVDHGDPAPDAVTVEIVARGDLTVCPLAAGAEALVGAVLAALGRDQAGNDSRQP